MSYFILEMVFLVSVSVMVYIVARKLPIISDIIEQAPVSKKEHQPIIRHEWIEAMDKQTSALTEKWLRRIKLVVMRFDNAVSKRLDRVREKQQDEQNGRGILTEAQDLTVSQEEEKNDNQKQLL